MQKARYNQASHLSGKKAGNAGWEGENHIGPKEPLRRHRWGSHLRRSPHEQGRLHKKAFWKIDWDAMEDSMNEFPQLFQCWVTKHVSHFCATGKMQLIEEPVKTATHLLICPHEGMQDNWDDFDKNASSHQRVHHQNCVATRVGRFLRAQWHVQISDAAREQDEIGWQNFMERKFSSKWLLDIQERHCRNVGSRRTARGWAQNLVSLLLEMVHGQWLFGNGMVHKRDAQGILIAEGVELAAAITEQFDLAWHGRLASSQDITDLPGQVTGKFLFSVSLNSKL